MLKLSNEENFNIIKELYLNNFRNHSEIELNSNGKSVLIHGNNGAGKTSILEAISIFSNRKGIKNSKSNEMLKKNTKQFSVRIEQQINDVINTELACIYQEEKKKKRYFLNEKEISFSSKIKPTQISTGEAHSD